MHQTPTSSAAHERQQDDSAVALLRILETFARESRLPIPEGGISLDIGLEADLGLDSLGRSELLSRLERGLDTELPEEALLAATPRDLLNLIGAESKAPLPKTAQAGRIGSGACGEPEQAGTLLAALHWHLERHPERTHILFQGPEERVEPISYANLHRGAARVAGRLLRKGLRCGDRVALMLPTAPGYFFAFFGVLSAGAIPVPIYPPARPQQLEEHLRRHARILANAGIGYLITVPEARAVGRLLAAQVPSLRSVLTLEALDREEPLATPRDAATRHIAFLQYTSGSTGDPKGVILTHADLLANIRAMGQAARATGTDVFVSWLPLYHDMGLIGAWLGSLYYGIPLVCMSPLAFLAKPLRWLQAIDQHRGTLSAAPNFAYELCLSRIPDAALAGLDLSSWRWAFNGAEPVNAGTLRRFTERFARCGFSKAAIAPVYGLAEAGVGLAFPPPGRGPRLDCIDRHRFAQCGHALAVPCDDPTAMEVVACGRPLPGYLVRILDAQGRPLPERHEGLLQFQGPSATQGYFGNPQATARLIQGGWHDTGDRAYLAGGDIHLTGRVKDLIIRGGRNIYPYELEQAVGAIPGIRTGCVAAFAAADPHQGSERLVVVAETREQDIRRRSELARSVRERAGDILGLPPDEVVLAPPGAVLKTSSGKLRRNATRDRYLAGRLHCTAGHPLWQLLRVTADALRSRTRHLLQRFPEMLFSGYAWTLFGLIGFPVALGIVVLPRPAWRWWLVRSATKLLLRLTRIRLRLEGRRELPGADCPLVVVVNHQSYLDALVLIAALPRPLVFIAKRELQRIALVGRVLRQLDVLFVERFDPTRSIAQSPRFTAVLRQGNTLVFFPEGTFRDHPGLLPFRMGAFSAAASARAPVVPVALSGTREILQGERRILRAGTVRVHIGAPLAPKSEDWQAAIDLRDATRDQVLRHCGEPDSAPAPGGP